MRPSALRRWGAGWIEVSWPPAVAWSEDFSLIEIRLKQDALKAKTFIIFSPIFQFFGWNNWPYKLSNETKKLEPNSTPCLGHTAHRANLTGCICRDLNDGVTCNRRGCWGSFSNVHGSCGILATDVFYSTAAFIRCKVFCRSETNLPFLHKRKRGKKSVDAIWLLFTVTLSTVRTGGGGLPQKALTFTKSLTFFPH